MAATYTFSVDGVITAEKRSWRNSSTEATVLDPVNPVLVQPTLYRPRGKPSPLWAVQSPCGRSPRTEYGLDHSSRQVSL